MRRDLAVLAKIPLETIERIVQSVSSETGFASHSALAEKCRELTHDQQAGTAIANVLLNVKVDDVPDILRLVKQWFAQQGSDDTGFSEETVDNLKSVLPTLVIEYESIDRLRKLNRLQAATGQRLKDLQFICDARPIFDSKREIVDGFFANTTLVLRYEDADGEPSSFEVNLDDSQLRFLVESAEQALRKSKVLSNTLPNWVNVDSD